MDFGVPIWKRSWHEIPVYDFFQFLIDYAEEADEDEYCEIMNFLPYYMDKFYLSLLPDNFEVLYDGL